MKKIILSAIILFGAFFLWSWFSEKELHQPITADTIESITFWGIGNEIKATNEEIIQMVNWFNSATDIRANKHFAGSTPESGIMIKLKSGNIIGIISSGDNFEVQRNDVKKENISYWAKEPNIFELLLNLQGTNR
jgi:hypothetical protein